MRCLLYRLAFLGFLTAAAVPVGATTVVPAADPGELAVDSEAVFFARAGASTAVARSSFLTTQTELVVLSVISGPLAAGQRVEMVVPGGEIDGGGWAVAGSPLFAEGKVYLFFAGRGADEKWRPRLLAYSILRREREADGTAILVPLEEARELDRVGVHGKRGLIPAPVDEGRFVESLYGSLGGEPGWDWAPMMASSAKSWSALKEAPAGCVFMSSGGTNIRWRKFDGGEESQGIWADSTGDLSIEGGAFDLVANAVERWLNVGNTSLDLTYDGPKDYTMSCTDDDWDNPSSGDDIVVFNDPCDDIADISQRCSGTLAFGGPWFGLRHQFDNETWFTASSWFVVVNNDLERCYSNETYELMLTHELGHGLGFGHTADTQSLMHASCCNPPNELDVTCTEYTYPGAEEPLPALLTVPVIAYVDGVCGTPWRSDVTIANPLDRSLQLELTYQAEHEAPVTKTRSMPARATFFFEDIVPGLFGKDSGRGPLRVAPANAGDPLPVTVSRTYAVRPFGNLGSGLPADRVPLAESFSMPGLLVDDDYRSSVSVTADVDSQVRATFELFRGSDGLLKSSVRRTVPAGEQEQWFVDRLFTGLALPGVPMTVRVTLEQPGVTNASVVDNASTDSAVFLGKRPSTRWIVPVVARVEGRDGTGWTSDVSVWNASGAPVTVSLEYLAENTNNAGGGAVAPEIKLAAFETVTLDDVIRRHFGVINGKGALVINASGAITVTSRVATAGPNGGISGNGVRTVPGEEWSEGMVVLPGVRMRYGFRTNVGFVTGDQTETFICKLWNGNGQVVAEGFVKVKPRSMRQRSVEQIFGSTGYDLPDPVGTITVEGDQRFLSYLTVIDGTSQDPVFIMPM